ncbi:ABC transporter permease [Verrucomicrobia bacterium]|nr:ABC transporter permease [Verrucomicrobiota bacterium]
MHPFLLLLRVIHLRHWTRHPLTSLAFCGIIAVGVAAFFSIRLANRAAISGFTYFDRSLGLRPDLVLTSPSGQFSEEDLFSMQAQLDATPCVMAPVLETTATDAAQKDASLNLQQFLVVGLDTFAMSNLAYHDPDRVNNLARQAWQEQPRQLETSSEAIYGVVISEALATKQKLDVGGLLEVIIDDRKTILSVMHITSDEVFQVSHPSSVLFMSISDLQRAMQQPKLVHRVELYFPPGHDKKMLLSTARDQLGMDPRWKLDTAETSMNSNASMTRAFRLNLTILSMLALVVGMYLIMQGMDAAIVRGRMEIATLRSLGVTPGALKSAWLMESLWYGVLGSAGGLALGWFGAQWMVRSVASTVNALYLQSASESADWNHSEAILAMTLGCLASLAAGWFPSSESAETQPAETFKQGRQGGFMTALNKPLWGIAIGLSGWGAASLPPYADANGWIPVGGYAAALLWVVSATLIAPAGLRWIAPLLRPMIGAHAVFMYAFSQLRRPTGRHQLSVAALTVAVGMAGGMTFMIHSFESTMIQWISGSLKADLYIACQGVGSVSSQNRMSRETWQAISGHPKVERAEVGQMFPIEYRGRKTYLTGMPVRNPLDWEYAMWIEAPDLDPAALEEKNLPSAAVNESFQTRFDVHPGDQIKLPTPGGYKEVRIVGVFAEYGNEHGTVAIDRHVVSNWFQDERAVNIALHLKSGSDPDRVRNEILSQHAGISIRTNRALRNEVLEIFHQTFSVTYVLQWIAVMVAIAGLTMAMITSLMERQLEFQVMKNLGMTRLRMAVATGLEGLACAWTGFGFGMILSMCLGWLLVSVINKQAFGWTLQSAIPWWDHLRLLVALTLATLITTIPVGWWASTKRMHKEE